MIFPEGIVIGTVDKQELSENLSLGKARLEFITDFNSLLYVYVLENLLKEEQEILLNDSINE